MLDEEYEALRSMFCLPGECQIEDGGVSLTLNIALTADPGTCTSDLAHLEENISVQIILQPADCYPNTVPEISIISAGLNRELIAEAKQRAAEHCSNIVGEPMLVSLAVFIQDYLKELVNNGKICRIQMEDESSSAESKENSVWTSVLHIDHMRSKTKYCKTLEKWASDLNLHGRLVFCCKLILVVLQGDCENIKDFIVRLKTVSIDVDSRGHSCKERMMKVLCEVKHDASEITRFTNFGTEEVTDMEKVCKLFEDAGLQTLYQQFIVSIR